MSQIINEWKSYLIVLAFKDIYKKQCCKPNIKAFTRLQKFIKSNRKNLLKLERGLMFVNCQFNTTLYQIFSIFLYFLIC
jgi:hypothetical protein